MLGMDEFDYCSIPLQYNYNNNEQPTLINWLPPCFHLENTYIFFIPQNHKYILVHNIIVLSLKLLLFGISSHIKGMHKIWL
jgi:hypothetical protein